MGNSAIYERCKESDQKFEDDRKRAIMPMHVYTAFPAFEPSHLTPCSIMRPAGLSMPY